MSHRRLTAARGTQTRSTRWASGHRNDRSRVPRGAVAVEMDRSCRAGAAAPELPVAGVVGGTEIDRRARRWRRIQ